MTAGVRARILDAGTIGDLAAAVRGLSASEANALARAHPVRPVVVEGLADPAPLLAALQSAGVAYARAGDAVVWAADPATTAKLHERLGRDAPGVLAAVHRARASWGGPAPNCPLASGEALLLSERCHVMGIVNVTPDSFSDGGHTFDASAAIEHGRALAADGADILDVGGESTRPGAEPVPEREELRRVVPVVAALAESAGVPVSIDTRKAAVAEAALDAGAAMVNDVSAGRDDPAMLPLVASRRAPIVLMHMRGDPQTMQTDPVYDDVVGEVASFLFARAAAARAAGIRDEQILVDPGFGFGKTREHNLVLLRRLRELRSLGHAVVAGTSRKSFIGATLGGAPPDDRLAGTAATVALAVVAGAAVVRVHDVREMSRVRSMVEAALGAAGGPPAG